jgi:hypothetical protein
MDEVTILNCDVFNDGTTVCSLSLDNNTTDCITQKSFIFNDPVYAEGIYGQCASFNGSEMGLNSFNAGIHLDGSVARDKTTFSVSCWVKGSGVILQSDWYGDAVYGYATGWGLGTSYIEKCLTPYSKKRASFEDIDVNNWHHIVYNVDHNGYCDMYVDNHLYQHVDISGSVFYNGQNYANTGENIGSSYHANWTFTGLIDSFRVFDRFLTLHEINILYNEYNKKHSIVENSIVENSIFAFKYCDSTGLDKVPVGSLILNKSTGDIFRLDNMIDILSTTKFCDVVGKSLVLSTGRFRGEALFHGGSSLASTNIFNYYGNLTQAETIVGTGSWGAAGSDIQGLALFYGDNNTLFSKVCLLTNRAVLQQAESSIGTARAECGGANAGINALFYGGDNNAVYFSKTTLLNNIGTLVQAETNVGLINTALAGVNTNSNCLFYGGYDNNVLNRVSLLSYLASQSQADTYVGTARLWLSGAKTLNGGIFYSSLGTSTYSNTVTLLSSTGLLLQAETNVGIVRKQVAGASSDINCLFYGGTNGVDLNTLTLLNFNGMLYSSEINVGTARYAPAGASV